MEKTTLITKAELLVKLGDLEEKLDDELDVLRLHGWGISDELIEIVDECVDDLESSFMDNYDFESLRERIEDAETEEELEDIEATIDEINDEIDNLSIDDDLVLEKIDNYFIYYSDAWEYLENQDITDFEDAFNEGCTNICSIATHYLMEEYWGL